MANTISYDSRCYYVDGKPVWLVSGAMHYFRVPHELWEDRIHKAKLAGLNCIETYVDWNLHESKEGTFDFEGDQDIDRFLTLIEEAGMYVIVRPGPYICSEWDNGAIPAWLSRRPRIRLREDDPEYLKAVDRWFDRLLPIITRHQVSRGGGVILVQNENEYLCKGRPGGKEYLEHINRKYRSSGIDVPIIVCNFLRVRIEDTVECWNAWDGLSDSIGQLRQAQPEAPKMITEFWDGWFEYYGMQKGQFSRSPASVFRRNCEMIGCGAMWNYYMWHGGTNFGFMAGRTCPEPLTTVTTSYDFDAPLSEQGRVTPKYLATKTANWMAQCWGEFLCQASSTQPSATVEGPFILQELASERGSLLVVRTQTDDQEERLAVLTLSDGTTFDVDLSDLQAALIPIGLKTDDGRTVDYTNGCTFCPDSLWIFGKAGSKGVISVDGERVEFTYPVDDKPQAVKMKSGKAVVLSTEGINHMWIVGDDVVYGSPDFPEESGLAPRKKLITVPELSEWQAFESFPQTAGGGEGWIRTDGPKSMDDLDHFFGYGWYRCESESNDEGEMSLYFPRSGDRLLVFLDGGFIDTFGRGAGAAPHPVSVNPVKGRNTLVVLADNMGRANFGRKLGEMKGIWDKVGVDWNTVPTPQSTVPTGGIPEEAKDQWELTTIWFPLPEHSRSLFWDLDLEANESLHLSLSNLQQYSYVYVNGKLAYYHTAAQSLMGDLSQNEFDLSGFIREGENKIELRILDWPSEEPPAGVALYRHRKTDVLSGDWSFLPFDPSQAKAESDHQPLRLYRATFTRPADSVPLFVSIGSLGKGHIYLNGRPLGRYWSIGPQERLYIPEPWVKDTNELVIFEEQGRGPEGVVLEI